MTVYFALQYADMIGSGAKMRWAGGTLFGSYLSVNSMLTDIVFLAMLLLGAVAVYSEVRRRRAQRRRWSLRVVHQTKEEDSQHEKQ
jgi:putative copper export protein